MDLIRTLAAIVHALAGAAWFGSMFYSLTVFQPRALAYFVDPGRFEDFIAAVSRGARWKVLSAFGIVLLSGVALVLFGRPRPVTGIWIALIIVKSLLFLAALALFCHVSWNLWPARIFATPEEAPLFQKRFRRIGLILLLLVGSDLVLGVMAHTLARR
jgi:uncharacterized membrane protein